MSILLDSIPVETGYSLVCGTGGDWGGGGASRLHHIARRNVEDFVCVADRPYGFSITDSSGGRRFSWTMDDFFFEVWSINDCCLRLHGVYGRDLLLW
jgi:hypothetical protein